jgi:3-hydroxyisobutyrate dehydrogenase-like beta-hydroxyacid dehydrogenase
MTTIGLIGLGDMGGGVGRSLVGAGHKVIAVHGGRSGESLERARVGGIEDCADTETLVRSADVILSIVPPGIAPDIAADVASILDGMRDKPVFADLNAVAPARSREMAERIEAAGGVMVDGGIIGRAPFKTPNKTRIYLSGSEAGALAFLATDEIDVRPCGPDVGQASGLKMVYAALSKGTMTLHSAVALAAHQMGIMDIWQTEMSESQPDKLAAIKGSVPYIAADSVRWADEMDEIAASFAAVGVTSKFHQGAGEIFRLMAATPLEAETRATVDRSRTLEEALEIYAMQIKRS